MTSTTQETCMTSKDIGYTSMGFTPLTCKSVPFTNVKFDINSLVSPDEDEDEADKEDNYGYVIVGDNPAGGWRIVNIEIPSDIPVNGRRFNNAHSILSVAGVRTFLAHVGYSE
jgi:hypothetical protein